MANRHAEPPGEAFPRSWSMYSMKKLLSFPTLSCVRVTANLIVQKLRSKCLHITWSRVRVAANLIVFLQKQS
jgi:hypothetical protein